MSHKGLGTPCSLPLEAMMGSLAHHQLSLYLEKLDPLDMFKPRNKHLAGKPLTVPGHTAILKSSS